MAIKPAVKYPGKTAPASDAYPLGAARDITTPGDGTGTPLRADWINDIWGFLQALLAEGGVTASGVPDTAQASQYLTALQYASSQLISTHNLSTSSHADIRSLISATTPSICLQLSPVTNGTGGSYYLNSVVPGSPNLGNRIYVSYLFDGRYSIQVSNTGDGKILAGPGNDNRIRFTETGYYSVEYSSRYRFIAAGEQLLGIATRVSQTGAPDFSYNEEVWAGDRTPREFQTRKRVTGVIGTLTDLQVEAVVKITNTTTQYLEFFNNGDSDVARAFDLTIGVTKVSNL